MGETDKNFTEQIQVVNCNPTNQCLLFGQCSLEEYGQPFWTVQLTQGLSHPQSSGSHAYCIEQQKNQAEKVLQSISFNQEFLIKLAP